MKEFLNQEVFLRFLLKKYDSKEKIGVELNLLTRKGLYNDAFEIFNMDDARHQNKKTEVRQYKAVTFICKGITKKT